MLSINEIKETLTPHTSNQIFNGTKELCKNKWSSLILINQSSLMIQMCIRKIASQKIAIKILLKVL